MTEFRPFRLPAQSVSRLRIALFSGNYNCTKDGSNGALNKLVARLLERGAAVRVYSPTTARPAFEPTGTLISVPSLAIPGRSDYRVALGLPRHVREDVDRFSPNVVHVSAPDFLGTSAQWYANERCLPIVASFHTRFDTYLEYYRIGFLRDWLRERQARFYQNADVVLAPNDAIANDLLVMGVVESSIRHWGRGVDASRFNAAHRDLNWQRMHGIADADVVVAFLGRLVVEKGIRLFAAVIEALARTGCRVRPVVIGSGPADRSFRKLLPGALFLGHLDGNELNTALASCDILLNPSKTEAFGNVILEAMASGLAVVSADEPSAQALITNGIDGLLADGRVSELASGVRWLVEEPDARKEIGAAAQRTSAAHRWNPVNDEAIDTYLELLAHSHRTIVGQPMPNKGRPRLAGRSESPRRRFDFPPTTGHDRSPSIHP